jgi:hypothetical protein
MTHVNAKLDAIVARIRAEVEIRRTKSGKATVETAKTRDLRQQRERGSDPALTALMRASNGMVFRAKPDPYQFFREIARTHVLQKQICRCCDSMQINVVAEMLHLRGKRDADSPIVDIWIRRSSVQTLPHEQPIWSPPHAVEFCADCVLIGAQTSCWEQAVVTPEFNGQLPLIN